MAAEKRKNSKDSSDVKRAKKVKSVKPPTLKQRHQKEGKVVKAGDLNWKPVEVPDHWDDYEGLMGLEELSGVTVRYVNGKPELIQMEEDGEGEKGDKEAKKDDKKNEKKNDKKNEKKNEKKNKKDVNDPKNEAKKDTKIPKKDAKKKAPEGLTKGGFGNLPEESVESLNTDVVTPVDTTQWASLNLSPETITGISNLGFSKPTEIQKQTINQAINGTDIIGKASTGSGKTLAYGIPILERYLKKDKEDTAPTAVIFAPTRELAHQVVKHLEKLAKSLALAKGIVSVTGGLAIQKQQRLLKLNPGVVVATPGRFLELLQSDPELCRRLSSTKMLVLDEADRLLQDGHFEEFDKILELFKKQKTDKWQTLVFSATFGRDLFMKLDRNGKTNRLKGQGSSAMSSEEVIQLLSKKLSFRNTPQFVDANPKEMVSLSVTEALIECGATERDLYVYYFILMYPGSTLVFANSIDSVKRLAPLLKYLGISAFAIHSNMEQKARLRSLERFQAAIDLGKPAVLVASDVAARGLDIPNIDHVIHYHIPKSADVYIHRSGRTARAGKQGVALTLCSPQEALGPLRKLRRVVASSSKAMLKRIGGDLKLMPIEYELVGQVTPRVRLAAKLADNDILTAATLKEGLWVNQMAEDLGIEDLDDLEAFEDDILKRQRKRAEGKMLSKNETKGMRAQLKQLMAVPLRKNVRRSYITLGLDNLAHAMVTGAHHKEVMGLVQTDALDQLK